MTNMVHLIFHPLRRFSLFVALSAIAWAFWGEGCSISSRDRNYQHFVSIRCKPLVAFGRWSWHERCRAKGKTYLTITIGPSPFQTDRCSFTDGETCQSRLQKLLHPQKTRSWSIVIRDVSGGLGQFRTPKSICLEVRKYYSHIAPRLRAILRMGWVSGSHSMFQNKAPRQMEERTHHWTTWEYSSFLGAASPSTKKCEWRV